MKAMTAARTASRVPSDDYGPAQKLMLALWLFDIWDGAGFSIMFEGEGRRFMPRLLVGACIAAMKGRPLSITDAFIVMDTKHGRTANKYIDTAVASGLLKKDRRVKADARKTFLLPTDHLETMFAEETTRLGDDARELIVALLQDKNGLPNSGAPILSIPRGQRNEPNRHIARAESSAPFPTRGWGAGYHGSK